MTYDENKISEFCGANGGKRIIHIWENNKKQCVVICIHGGLSHGGDFVNVGQYFRDKDLVILSYDMRGHFNVKKAHIDSFDGFLSDLALFINWVKAHYPGLPIFLLGHSMGALVIANYRLKETKGYESISGYIMSSPYFEGVQAPTSKQFKALCLLAKALPNLNFPVKNHNHLLTRDKKITERILLDKKSNIRARQITIGFLIEIIKAQNYLKENFHHWSEELFVVTAGTECLSNWRITHKILNSVKSGFVELEFYSDNYHENFNEINRNEIFQKIHCWLNLRLGIHYKTKTTQKKSTRHNAQAT